MGKKIKNFMGFGFFLIEVTLGNFVVKNKDRRDEEKNYGVRERRMCFYLSHVFLPLTAGVHQISGAWWPQS